MEDNSAFHLHVFTALSITDGLGGGVSLSDPSFIGASLESCPAALFHPLLRESECTMK